MRNLFDDTIAAPATLPGTGAISVIRLSGPEAIPIADRFVRLRKGRLADKPANTIHLGQLVLGDGSLLDEVLVSLFRAPHSYTGEDSVEISCHASRYIAEQLLLALGEAGARPAAPGEFTRRAFVNGKLDLTQAESVADLVAAENKRAHDVALNQLRGGFSSELRQIRERLTELSALLELELDFSEEDVTFADRGQLSVLLEDLFSRTDRLLSSFRWGNAIRSGIPTSIAGAPNAGKSTVLNQLLGDDRALVSELPGTTRDTIEENLTLDGVLFRLVDTAGLHDTEERIERMGIERAGRRIAEADIVLAVFDASLPEAVLAEQARTVLGRTDPRRQHVVILLNKMDLLSDDPVRAEAGASLLRKCFVEAAQGDYSDGRAGENGVNKNVSIYNKDVSLVDNKDITVIPISAATAAGMEAVKARLIQISRLFLPDQTTQTTVTNARHYEALSHMAASLRRLRSGLADALPSDLLAQDLRETLYHLGTITGEITTDEILGTIFSKFCIGK